MNFAPLCATSLEIQLLLLDTSTAICLETAQLVTKRQVAASPDWLYLGWDHGCYGHVQLLYL